MFSKKDEVFSRSSEVRTVDFSALKRVEHEPQSLEEGSFVSDIEPEMDYHAEFEAARKQAYQEGLAEGRAIASEEFRRTQSEELALEKALLDKLLSSIDELTDDAEDAVIHLSRAFAEAILEREIELPETVVHITRAAIQRACGLDTIHVYVNPTAVPILENHLHMLRPDDPMGKSISILGDNALSPGDVRIVSDGGHIEGILQDRLDRLVESAFVSISEVSMGE